MQIQKSNVPSSKGTWKFIILKGWIDYLILSFQIWTAEILVIIRWQQRESKSSESFCHLVTTWIFAIQIWQSYISCIYCVPFFIQLLLKCVDTYCLTLHCRWKTSQDLKTGTKFRTDSCCIVLASTLLSPQRTTSLKNKKWNNILKQNQKYSIRQ